MTARPLLERFLRSGGAGGCVCGKKADFSGGRRSLAVTVLLLFWDATLIASLVDVVGFLGAAPGAAEI